MCVALPRVASQMQTMFAQLDAVNTAIMQGNETLPQLIPALLNQEINVDTISLWLTMAGQQLTAAGGSLVQETIAAYIADTKALITADLAFAVAFQQVQSIANQVRWLCAVHCALHCDVGAMMHIALVVLLQLALLDAAYAQLQNNIAETRTERLGINGAMSTLQAQLYNVQFRVLQVMDRACKQYAFTVLTNCSACALMPYPGVGDIDSFIEVFTTCPTAPASPPPNDWYTLTFNASTHPLVFADAENGNFSVEIYVPANATGVNVRTLDFRFYVLPLNALVGTPLSPCSCRRQV